MDTPIDETLLHPNLCGILPVIGARWGFPIVRILRQGPSHFKQLHRKIGSISTQSLTNTLRLLEQAELVQRQVIPTIPVTVEYSLTERGKDLEPVLKEMDAWFLKWEYHASKDTADKLS